MRNNAHVVEQGGKKSQAKGKGKKKGKVLAQESVNRESKCFFYKKKGHIKKDCVKFKA